MLNILYARRLIGAGHLIDLTTCFYATFLADYKKVLDFAS